MARRFRNFGGSRRGQKLSSNPPPPIEIKATKLNFTGLAQAYDWATIDQVFGMRLAFGWYNENAPILLAMDPPDAIRQKTYERAVKAQKLGEGTVIVEEQKQAFTTALHLFEKLWTPKQPALPLVDPALTPDAKPSKSLAWQQTLLEAFKVFQPFGLTYVPSVESTRSVLTIGADDNGNRLAILLPVTELAQVRGSVLSVLLKEAVEVAKQTSISYAGDVPQLDGNVFLATLPKVLEAVAGTVRGATSTAPKGPQAARPPRGPQGPAGQIITISGGRTIACPYKAGSANAAVFALLADEQSHTWEEAMQMSSAAGAKYPQDAMWFLKDHGIKNGKWAVVKDKATHTVRLTFA